MRLRTLLHTSVLQLTLIYVALFGVSVLALFYLIYWSTLGYLERQTNETIQVEIDGLLEQYERRGASGLADVISERVRRDDENRSVYLLADAIGRPLAGNLSYLPPDVLTGQWLDIVIPQAGGGGDLRHAGGQHRLDRRHHGEFHAPSLPPGTDILGPTRTGYARPGGRMGMGSDRQ